MSDLTVMLQSIDEKVKFIATARENPEIVIDYFKPLGTEEGYTPLELLLASFSSCVSSVLLTLLRHRMKKVVNGISVEAKGTVREEHPKAITHILLLIKIMAKDLTETELRNALKIAEDTMCPVWSMIKGNVTVEAKTEINGLP